VHQRKKQAHAACRREQEPGGDSLRPAPIAPIGANIANSALPSSNVHDRRPATVKTVALEPLSWRGQRTIYDVK
jgi:hypothetical protein